MRPTLFHIGSFAVSSYGTMIFLAFVLGAWAVIHEAKRKNLDIKLLWSIILLSVVTGHVGAKIQHILFDGFFDVYMQRPAAMFNVNQGYAFLGGIIFSLITIVSILHYKQKPVTKYLDVLSYGAAIGIAIGRVGCTLAGCCFGEITSSGLGIMMKDYGLAAKTHFAHDYILSLNSHPYPVFAAQPISAAVNFMIFLFLYFVVRKRYTKDGVPFGSWLIMYSVFRIFIEFFRDDARGLFFGGMLSTSQIISILLIIVGIILIKLPSEKKTAQ